MFSLHLNIAVLLLLGPGHTATVPALQPLDTTQDIQLPGQGGATYTYRIGCSPDAGVGLEARTCFNALDYAPRGTQQVWWIRDNYRPQQHPVPGGIRLPIATLSNDTNCAISLILLPQQNVGQASAFNVSQAARAVIMACVIPRRIGGFARDIGGDNKVAVAIEGRRKRSNPAVCQGAIRATTSSCGYILDEMIKNSLPENFGRPEAAPYARISVALPITLRSPDGLCQILVDKLGDPYAIVDTTWQGLWYAAEMVAAQCARSQGRGGYSIVTGNSAMNKSLNVTIMDEPAAAALPGGPNGNSSTA